MKIVKLAFMVAAVMLICGSPKPLEAKSYFSFGYYGPGVSFHAGHYPRYSHYPYYYYPHHYYPHHYYGHRRSYYRQSYRSPKRYRTYGGRCARWSKRCAANWGRSRHDYNGCMRYHRCR